MFSTIDKFLGGALVLIFIFLVLDKSRGAETILDSLAKLTTGTFRTLQGR